MHPYLVPLKELFEQQANPAAAGPMKTNLAPLSRREALKWLKR